MRRTGKSITRLATAAMATSLAGIWFAASASAGTGFNPDYGGHIESDPAAYFGFEVNKTGGERKFQQGFFYGENISCTIQSYDGRLGIRTVNRSLRIDGKGRFSGTGEGQVPQNRGGSPRTYKVKIKGRIKGRKASGSLKLTQKGAGNHCYTGVLTWKARRPAAPPPRVRPAR